MGASVANHVSLVGNHAGGAREFDGIIIGGGHHALLRQYLPRGTDFSRISQSYLNAIALRLNQRPRKTLGFETPADRLQAVLH
jgi:hypothetical protein